LSSIGDGFDVRSLALTFRSGATLARHRHEWGQLVFASSGVMYVATEAEAWLVPPTKALWLPAGLEHQISVRGEVAMRTLYLAPDRAQSLSGAPRALEVAPVLREVILYILKIGMLAPTRPDHDRLAGVLVDLLLTARPLDLSLPLPRDLRALRIARHFQGNPDDRTDLAVLAQQLGASLRTLQRLFPGQTGLTLEAWRQKARVIHALSRLTSGASVTDAAFDSGYHSVGAFIGAFTRQFGVTPGQYFSG
jgi:AraC-like DNA-binding protein